FYAPYSRRSSHRPPAPNQPKKPRATVLHSRLKKERAAPHAGYSRATSTSVRGRSLVARRLVHNQSRGSVLLKLGLAEPQAVYTIPAGGRDPLPRNGRSGRNLAVDARIGHRPVLLPIAAIADPSRTAWTSKKLRLTCVRRPASTMFPADTR